jgi:hypothetical protein
MVPRSVSTMLTRLFTNVNGGVYKVNEQLLNSLSISVNKTHATFTNVNAAAPNAGGDVSNTSQVRSTYSTFTQLDWDEVISARWLCIIGSMLQSCVSSSY